MNYEWNIILDNSTHKQIYYFDHYYIQNNQLPKFGAEEHLSNCDLLFIKFTDNSVVSFNNSFLIFWFSFFFLDIVCLGKLQ